MKQYYLSTGIYLLYSFGILCQLFSAFVSHDYISAFIEPYFPLQMFATFMGLLLVLGIEVGIRVFGSIALERYDSPTPNIVFGSAFALLLILSAYLTTVAPAKIAVRNTDYIEYRERAESDIAPLQAQVEADQAALTSLQKAVAAREGAWITKQERASLEALNKRIERAQSIIAQELANRGEANKQIESRNSAIAQEAEQSHMGFGFLSQLALVLTMIGIRVLEKERGAQQQGNVSGNTGKPQGNPRETIGATGGQPQGNDRENDIKISNELIMRIAQLKGQGLSHKQVAEQLDINKGTVSKALHQFVTENHKSGNISEDELDKVLKIYGISRPKGI